MIISMYIFNPMNFLIPTLFFAHCKNCFPRPVGHWHHACKTFESTKEVSILTSSGAMLKSNIVNLYYMSQTFFYCFPLIFHFFIIVFKQIFITFFSPLYLRFIRFLHFVFINQTCCNLCWSYIVRTDIMIFTIA